MSITEAKVVVLTNDGTEVAQYNIDDFEFYIDLGEEKIFNLSEIMSVKDLLKKGIVCGLCGSTMLEKNLLGHYILRHGLTEGDELYARER